MSIAGLYLITIVPILLGLAIIFKESGWPSERARNNRLLRSIRSGLGGTLLVSGLIVLLNYRLSPGSFIADMSLRSIFRFAFLVVLPIFFIGAAGSYVEYSVRDRAEPAARERLHKIVEKWRKGSS